MDWRSAILFGVYPHSCAVTSVFCLLRKQHLKLDFLYYIIILCKCVFFNAANIIPRNTTTLPAVSQPAEILLEVAPFLARAMEAIEVRTRIRWDWEGNQAISWRRIEPFKMSTSFGSDRFTWLGIRIVHNWIPPSSILPRIAAIALCCG